MSLPSNAFFLDADCKVVKHGFCNIGWNINLTSIPRIVGEAMQDAELEQDDWKYVVLYEMCFTKKQLNLIMKKEFFEADIVHVLKNDVIDVNITQYRNELNENIRY
jgi:hypothetical protein